MTNDFNSYRVNGDFPSSNRFFHEEKEKKPVRKDPNFMNAIKGFVKSEDEKKKKRIERKRLLARYDIE